jgi:uncharacterized membrane protein
LPADRSPLQARIGATRDRLRGSLFPVPVAFVVAGALLGEVLVSLDRHLTEQGRTLSFVPDATADSARAVLSTVATATIGIAGIAFSISLLIIQLASSQYSPRIVHSLFRDPFTKRVMGVVLGTFTYCLVVMGSVHNPGELGADAVVPNLSVGVALALGLLSVLATVGFIDHSAHSMDVSKLLHRVATEALESAEQSWPAPGVAVADLEEDEPAEPGYTVTFDRNGWIQRVDSQALLDVIPAHGTVRLESAVGRYALAGRTMVVVWPVPPEAEQAGVEAAVRAAVHVGSTRTMHQDPAFGVRQLVDVALKALSPGINDPTTAQDAIFHVAAVLRDLLERESPSRTRRGAEGRRLLRHELPDHEEIVGLAFDELRPVSANQPTVCIYLLEAIHVLGDSPAVSASPERMALLRTQAELVLEACEAAEPARHDRDRVRAAFARRFG